MVTILGIDPGLQATGWGAIRVNGSALAFVGSGTITSNPKAALADRLATLYAGLERVLTEIAPDETAVEATFVSRDGAATLKLGQARGIALLAPAVRGLPVAEYAPNLVKKTVVGAGHADKRQIRHMIGVLLPKSTARSDHAADALAIAICHASHRRARARVAAAA
ncbi:crossover junction endodeoxyribonuclease RuvC [Stappia sp. 22II-S9-Z10]|nr:crossover junction endodeoxyribonuclease RuvC [Stappia sp. 22II-S9-Z10]